MIRLSLLYALLDRSAKVGVEHLQAALDLWDHVEASTRFVFGDGTANTRESKLLDAIRQAPAGLTRSQIVHDVFQGNMGKDKVAALLSDLLTAGLIQRTVIRPPVGRPIERWTATGTTPRPRNHPERADEPGGDGTR